jgi:hypothetical protein
MMQTDVQATHIDANGVIFAGPCRVKGFALTPGGTAGEVQFYDNVSAASGTIRLVIHASTNLSGNNLTLPGEGIRFYNGVYVSMPANTHLTVFYG